MIHFLCSGCKKALKAKDEDGGKQSVCKCGTKNTIPESAQKKPEPPIRMKEEPLPEKAPVDTRVPPSSYRQPSPPPIVNYSPPKVKKSQSPFLEGLSIILILGGVLGSIYFLFMFNTTVYVGAAGDEIGTRYVHNIGLMADRQNGLIGSIGAAVVGAILQMAFKRK